MYAELSALTVKGDNSLHAKVFILSSMYNIVYQYKSNENNILMGIAARSSEL